MSPKRQRRGHSAAALLGARIRSLRVKGGLSQEELAEKAGIHVTYLSGLERGRRNPTLAVMAGVAAGLGVPIAALFSAEKQ